MGSSLSSEATLSLNLLTCQAVRLREKKSVNLYFACCIVHHLSLYLGNWQSDSNSFLFHFYFYFSCTNFLSYDLRIRESAFGKSLTVFLTITLKANQSDVFATS